MGHKISENTKNKISESNKKKSNETSKKMSIIVKSEWDNNPQRKKEFSKNNPMKRPEVKIKFTGENNPAKRMEVREKFKGDLNPSKRPEVRKKLSENHADFSLNKHPNWQGGKSFEPYCPKFTKNKREEIRNKYQRKCFACNKNENDNITKSGKIRKLSVHHIDMDKEQGCNGKKFILVPLCLKCHGRVHFNENLQKTLIPKLGDE